ncbi:hypothetical protein Bca101_093084 [Brassica carinata]
MADGNPTTSFFWIWSVIRHKSVTNVRRHWCPSESPSEFGVFCCSASKKTPPSKEFKNMMKLTKNPPAPISNASTPRVYKPASKPTPLSTVKKENVSSSLLRNKQTASKSLHMSMSLGPSTSDPSALTSTRKSLIMERMGDKNIVKRAFKTSKRVMTSQVLSTSKSRVLQRQLVFHHVRRKMAGLQNQVAWRREVVLVLFVLHSKATTLLRTNKRSFPNLVQDL